MGQNKDTACLAATRSLVFLAVISAIISCSAAKAGSLSPDHVQPAQHIDIIGHRGTAGLAPENTLAHLKRPVR